MPSLPDEVDVLIVGGGPAGLILAYSLALFSNGGTKIAIIERHPKSSQEIFGRAVTFWCRSMELLSQLGLAPLIAQQAFACRTSANFDKDGNLVEGRGWSFLENISDTKWDCATVLRQKFVEEILRGELKRRWGIETYAPVSFVDCQVNESIEIGGHRVTAYVTIPDGSKTTNPPTSAIKTRFLIGADGARTQVRRALKIESSKSGTLDKWVRIDGLLRSTTNPKPRSYGAIESPTHGNVLWVPLDHGCTRIGFALSEERLAALTKSDSEVAEAFAGGAVITPELAVAEAKAACLPFEIDFARVDWASSYIVRQSVADKFAAHDCCFLVGDACHTHSSGAGQGMNTAVHDVANLGWKLHFFLTGLADEKLLSTYESERRPNAIKLINYDRDISVLISNRLPESWTGDKNADPHAVLGEILKGAKGFNTGLAISYGSNILNLDGEEASTKPEATVRTDTIPTPAIPGYRAPEMDLLTPATFQATTLQNITPNLARFRVLVFTGAVKPEGTKKGTAQLIHGLTSAVRGSLLSKPTSSVPLSFLTIVPTKAVSSASPGSLSREEKLNLSCSAWEALDLQPSDNIDVSTVLSAPLGDIYYDPGGVGHSRYAVPEVSSGATEESVKIVLLRPDGWIGMVLDMKSTEDVLAEGKRLVGKLEAYFWQFMK